MGKIVKKYIGSDQVGSAQIRLENTLPLKARNAADDADVSILAVDATDKIVMSELFYTPDLSVPSADYQVANKKYVDDEVQALSDISWKLGGQALGSAQSLGSTDDFNVSIIRNSITKMSFFSGNTQIIGQTWIKSPDDIKFINFDVQNSGSAFITLQRLDQFQDFAILAQSSEGNGGNLSIQGPVVTSQVAGDGVYTAGSLFLNTFAESGYAEATNVAVNSGSIGISTANGFAQGTQSDANSGSITLQTGNAVGAGVRGNIIMSSRQVDVNAVDMDVQLTGFLTLFADGQVQLSSNNDYTYVYGETGLELSSSAQVLIQTFSAAGEIRIQTEPTFGQDIILNPDGATRNSSKQIKDVADPTDAQDAATKSYVDSQVSAGVTSDFEKIVLTATDITNQYVDLSDKYVIGSLDISSSRVVLNVSDAVDADYDFQGDNSGSVTRLIFQGPSATGGGEELVENDVLFIKGILA